MYTYNVILCHAVNFQCIRRGLIFGGGGGGLILLLFTSRWAYVTRGFIVGGGGGLISSSLRYVFK